MKTDWRVLHGKVIGEFLTYLNKRTNSFVLKGGTALARCYNLNRFSEDIDLDAKKENIIHHVQGFCRKQKFSFRIAKDTATVKRCFIDYGNQEKTLKIEVSYRNRTIPENDICTINGIKVYSIDRLAQMKSNAYNARDKIRDLFDLSFIVNNHYKNLSDTTLNVISDALQYKGLEQLDYILATQQDELIEPDKLLENFLEMHDKLSLLYSDVEEEILDDYSTDTLSPKDIAKELHTHDTSIQIIDKLKNVAVNHQVKSEHTEYTPKR